MLCSVFVKRANLSILYENLWIERAKDKTQKFSKWIHQVPKVRLALISDGIEIDPHREIFSILRIYHTRHVEEFPVDGDFYVIVFWDGSGDEYVQESFEIVNSIGNVIAAKPPARLFFDKSHQITFTHFTEILFQYPDVYTVNIYAEGQLAGTVRFAIAV